MIPSRGLRWSSQSIRVGRWRLETLSARSFSLSTSPGGSSNPSSLLPRAGAFSRKAVVRPQILRIPYTLQNGTSFRFQSTSQTATASGTKDIISTNIDSTTWAQNSSGLGSLDNAIDLSSASLHNIPEQIGYLKALGLDYGYGPTAMMEWVLEHVHVFAGTPWWASIAITAVLVRVVCLYPYILASDNAARMAIVAPIAKPYLEKMKDASRLGDTAEAMRIRAELQMINKRAGVSYLRSFIPLIQAPIGFGTFFLLRGMSKLPVPGLESGGVLWFSNLAIPDPYFLLPLATACILHWLLRKGGETGVQTISPGMLRSMSYFLPALSMAFTWWLPASVQLSFLVSGTLGFIQAQVFRYEPFRKFLNMTSMPKRPDAFAQGPVTEPSPYQPRIITAQKASSIGSYEPPRGTSSSSSPSGFPTPPKPTLLSGLTREIKGGIESVRTSARETLKSAREIANKERKDGKRTKKEIQQANEYEKKRRLEERQRLEQLDQERQARRKERRQREGR